MRQSRRKQPLRSMRNTWLFEGSCSRHTATQHDVKTLTPDDVLVTRGLEFWSAATLDMAACRHSYAQFARHASN